MNGLGFVAGGPQRFPINGHLRMLHISRFGLQAAWLVSASLLRFPTRKEGSQHLAEQMDIDDLSDPLVCHLAGHPRPFETKAHRQHFPSQTYPLGCSFQAGLSCQFGQHQQAEQDRQRVSLTRFSPGIWQLLQGFVQTWRQVVGFLSIHRRWHEGRIVHGESSLLFHFFECTREALFFGSDVDHMAHISPLASLLFSFLEWECPVFYNTNNYSKQTKRGHTYSWNSLAKRSSLASIARAGVRSGTCSRLPLSRQRKSGWWPRCQSGQTIGSSLGICMGASPSRSRNRWPRWAARSTSIRPRRWLSAWRSMPATCGPSARGC